MLLAKKIRTLLGLGFVLWIVLGCATAPPTPAPIPAATLPPPPTATAALIPSGWNIFSSVKYNYSIAFPGNWKVTPATEILDIRSSGIPHQGDDTADTFESPGRGKMGLVEIATQEISASMTLEDWTSANIQAYRNNFGCDKPDANENLRIAGERASLLIYHGCGAYYVLHVAIVHGHTGFLGYWRSDPGDEAKSRATFEQFLATLAFVN